MLLKSIIEFEDLFSLREFNKSEESATFIYMNSI